MKDFRQWYSDNYKGLWGIEVLNDPLVVSRWLEYLRNHGNQRRAIFKDGPVTYWSDGLASQDNPFQSQKGKQNDK